MKHDCLLKLLQVVISLHLCMAMGIDAVADDITNERPPKQAMEQGKAAYLANCAACHQADGKGLKGAFPPLAKSDFLKAPGYKEAIDVILGGRSGEIVVNGEKFNNVMPAMSHISDADLSAILTFVINSWGNPGGDSNSGCN